MTYLSKKDFSQLCLGSSGEGGISQIYIPEIVRTLEEAAMGCPPVIWLQGASCGGCSISLLDNVHPKLRNALIKIKSLAFLQQPVAKKNDFVEKMLTIARDYKGQFYLIIEGAIPTGADGLYCIVGEDADGRPISLLNLVKKLSASAKAVLALGTCAAFGGVPAIEPNPTGCQGVSKVLAGQTVINIPGCPPHSEWVIGTLVHVLRYGIPDLDGDLRPTLFYEGLDQGEEPLGYLTESLKKTSFS
ncbi:NADH-ubiquinone oxidoreductase [Thermincola potens]|uniref:NADH ubiquinone oxidoreductase 20 kDa subunit n=1 Tax=Thermincola potens (strain JR) TaxID=635013 RepID=D5XDS2_THEPJ|nr:NADH-ubiquinone oxidoreductase [Thermincola potens]ADG83818.1 NADH ubiquinone oxidoreductase 20 kDa subunit [Thermincola potens JR]